MDKVVRRAPQVEGEVEAQSVDRVQVDGADRWAVGDHLAGLYLVDKRFLKGTVSEDAHVKAINVLPPQDLALLVRSILHGSHIHVEFVR